MTAEELRRLLEDPPFRPFQVHMVTGRTLKVPHPDFMMVPPKGRFTAFGVDDDGYGTLINTGLIERITFDDDRASEEQQGAA